jgi:hypothetical protein
MVRCCAGHQPLSMQGKARKGHHLRLRLRDQLRRDRGARGPRRSEVHLGARGLARATRASLLRTRIFGRARRKDAALYNRSQMNLHDGSRSLSAGPLVAEHRALDVVDPGPSALCGLIKRRGTATGQSAGQPAITASRELGPALKAILLA